MLGKALKLQFHFYSRWPITAPASGTPASSPRSASRSPRWYCRPTARLGRPGFQPHRLPEIKQLKQRPQVVGGPGLAGDLLGNAAHPGFQCGTGRQGQQLRQVGVDGAEDHRGGLQDAAADPALGDGLDDGFHQAKQHERPQQVDHGCTSTHASSTSGVLGSSAMKRPCSSRALTS